MFHRGKVLFHIYFQHESIDPILLLSSKTSSKFILNTWLLKVKIEFFFSPFFSTHLLASNASQVKLKLGLWLYCIVEIRENIFFIYVTSSLFFISFFLELCSVKEHELLSYLLQNYLFTNVYHDYIQYHIFWPNIC